MDPHIISVTSTDSAISILKKFRKNWDGQNSPAIKVKVIKTLEIILRNIEHSKMPFPKVVPLSGGGVGLMWVSWDRDATVEISPNGSLSFSFVDKKFDIEGDQIGEDNTTGNLTSTVGVDYVIAWFSNNIAGKS